MFRLIEKLKKVKDFRQASGRRHQLWVVLLIIILGIMQSYIGYRPIGDFAKYNQAFLIKCFNLPGKKVPSYSTIRRVLMGLDWSELVAIFNEWAKEEYQNKEGLEWIAVDGKSLRNTVINHDEATQNFLMFASFFSQETGIVLHLERWENKESSEVHQVQHMIRNTELTDKNFTLEALHSNRVTPQEIIDSKNDYLITLKANQLNLYKHVKEVTNNSQALNLFRGLGFLSITQGQRWLDNRWFRLCDLLE